jgi:hypothetical protein
VIPDRKRKGKKPISRTSTNSSLTTLRTPTTGITPGKPGRKKFTIIHDDDFKVLSTTNYKRWSGSTPPLTQTTLVIKMKRKSKSVVIPPLKLNNTSVNALADAITSTSLSTAAKTEARQKRGLRKFKKKVDYRTPQMKRKVKASAAALRASAKPIRRSAVLRASHSGLSGDANYLDLRKIISIVNTVFLTILN